MRFQRAAVLMVALTFLPACAAKPSDKEVKELAKRYISSMPFGSSGDDIKIIKSYTKDGNVVMVIQSGSMICEMPMLKTDTGWVARGIHCGG